MLDGSAATVGHAIHLAALVTELPADPEGQNVVLWQTAGTGQDNEALMELLMATRAAKLAGAASVTAVTPLAFYSRQDRSEGKLLPVAAKLAADMLASAGANKILTMDLHSKRCESFFGGGLDLHHVSARSVLLDTILELGRTSPRPLILVAPDAGASERVRVLAEAAKCPMATIGKTRTEEGAVERSTLESGHVKDATAVIVDDMLDTCGTLVSASEALSEAADIVCMASHGIFSGNALDIVNDCDRISRVFVSNTIDQGDRPSLCSKLEVLDVAGIFGASLKAIILPPHA